MYRYSALSIWNQTLEIGGVFLDSGDVDLGEAQVASPVTRFARLERLKFPRSPIGPRWSGPPVPQSILLKYPSISPVGNAVEFDNVHS